MHEPLQFSENAVTTNVGDTGSNLAVPNNSRGERARACYISSDAPVGFKPVLTGGDTTVYAFCTLLAGPGVGLIVYTGGFPFMRFICKATLSAEVTISPLENF